MSVVVSDLKVGLNAEVVAAYNYYPFGMMARKYQMSGSNYRYGFNGKEKDDEINGNGNSYDFGARMYDPRIGRWTATDPLAKKYPWASPFVFVLNTPIQAIDPDGEKVYFLVYTSGINSDAAFTRKKEIENSVGFNKKTDKVYILKVDDFGKMEKSIEDKVAEAKKKGYGKTVEFSLWSHATGVDGPRGEEKASKNSMADVNNDPLSGAQLSPKGWKDIDFNFDPEESVAAFYGCNTSEWVYNKFMNYQPDVQYGAGQPGKAGDTYDLDNFSSVWFNIFGSDVWYATEHAGKTQPIDVYKRGYIGPVTYQNDDVTVTNDVYKEVKGNVTVDPKTKEPVSGSGK